MIKKVLLRNENKINLLKKFEASQTLTNNNADSLSKHSQKLFARQYQISHAFILLWGKTVSIYTI